MEVTANYFETTFDRLCAGVAEEDSIGKCARDQFIGQLFARLGVIEIGGMPQAVRLFRQCID
jgi:hypothetical protein